MIQHNVLFITREFNHQSSLTKYIRTNVDLQKINLYGIVILKIVYDMKVIFNDIIILSLV